MKQKNRQKKSLREVQTDINYSGERSPYWDFLASHQRVDADGTIQEDVIANPDSLSENDHLYHRPLSEEGESRLQFINEIIPELSPQQQRVLHLCGFLGKTQKEAAKELEITQQAVNDTLSRVKRIIQQRYEEDEQEEK